jgi:hypothetical protein
MNPSIGNRTLASALQRAVENDHLDVVERLWPMVGNANVFKAFRIAINNGHFAVMDFILGHAATIDRFAINEAFESAAFKQRIDMIDRLLDLNVGPCRSAVYYALGFASGDGQLDTVNRIMDNHVVMDERPEQQIADAMVESARNGHVAIFNRLITVLPIGFRTFDIEGALVGAAAHGDSVIVTQLLAFPIETMGINLENVIHEAVQNGHLAIIRQILEIYPPPLWSRRFLWDAASLGHTALVEFLIGTAMHPEQQSINRAFLLAASNGQADIVELLRERVRDDQQQDE